MREMQERFVPHGHVTIIDDLGNILVDKDNMIVKSGRIQIMKAVFSGEEIDKDNFNIYFDNYSKATTEDTDYTILKEYIKKTNKPDSLTVKDDDNNPHVEIVYKLSGIISAVCGLGLEYITGESDDEIHTLFSRVTYEPVYMKPNREYSVTYRIYF